MKSLSMFDDLFCHMQVRVPGNKTGFFVCCFLFKFQNHIPTMLDLPVVFLTVLNL